MVFIYLYTKKFFAVCLKFQCCVRHTYTNNYPYSISQPAPESQGPCARPQLLGPLPSWERGESGPPSPKPCKCPGQPAPAPCMGRGSSG